MPQEPFPASGPGGEEPQGSGLPPAGGNGPAEEPPPEGAEQGLFVTLPAEELSLAGFAEDGRADTMAPGPLLAAILSAVAGQDGAGLAGLSDDQLIGFLSGARRMESLASWTQMAALGEFARRHPGRGGSGVAEFAAEEIADELRLTGPAAAGGPRTRPARPSWPRPSATPSAGSRTRTRSAGHQTARPGLPRLPRPPRPAPWPAAGPAPSCRPGRPRRPPPGSAPQPAR